MKQEFLYDDLGLKIGPVKILVCINPTIEINEDTNSLKEHPDYAIGVFKKSPVPLVYEEHLNGWQIWDIGMQSLYQNLLYKQEIDND